MKSAVHELQQNTGLFTSVGFISYVCCWLVNSSYIK